MKKEQQSRSSAAAGAHSTRPLSALLSQILVAFTVEFDNDFVRDPAGTLPHYPLWDMNRGFGP